jgi:hypothetical protein
VQNFVSGIGSWIAAHKGPIQVDAELLVPHGNAIMDGLQRGLEGGYGQVQNLVSGIAGGIASAFPAQVPIAASGGAGAGAPVAAGGAGAPPLVLEIRSGGSAMDDLLVQILQKAIRSQGGNVQEVLGQ